MRTFITFFVISCSLILFSFNDLNVKPTAVRTIVIDAGHGGKDPGCSGRHSHEKDVAFELATEVGALVKAYLKDVRVVYTRKSKHEFVELNERARRANKENADLFISLHCNASESPAIHGTETYVMGLNSMSDNLNVAMRENASILKEKDYQQKYGDFDPSSPVSYIMMANFQNTYRSGSLKLAHSIEKQFKHRSRRHSRGVKQSGFLVLWKTSMPSVLVEAGFLTNRYEENFLNADRGQSRLAASLYAAIRNYKDGIENR